jgi:tRNA/tmRNA/rRNA uracil-C5-methylase (TrmA/RlmC/RlmD family)
MSSTVLELAVGDVRTVDVGPIAHGGHFIAHSDGRTLFVRHALPGERVVVRITEVNRRMVRADAIEILVPSADRVPAPCRWAGPDGCGGCDFQHVDVGAQRRLKAQVLRESLQRFGGLSANDPLLGVELSELPGAPGGLHWRTRMTWATDTEGQRGLRRYRSHDVVPVDECLIAGPEVCHPGAQPVGKVRRTVRDRAWRLSADGFWQVHPALPEALVDAVLDFGGPQPNETWWDLYSGAGLFSAFLAVAVGPGGSVHAVESDAAAVRDARRALHDLAQVRLTEGRVDYWLAATRSRPDGVVLDPPRAGAGAAILAGIAAARPRTIVYVACDPVALARDVAILAGDGYRLTRLEAFDAFPMTHHFETVAVFDRSDA